MVRDYTAPCCGSAATAGASGSGSARPGTGAKLPALDYDALRDERLAAEEAEERRLFYVAMTRAQERLILSGAARMDTWAKGNRSTPVDWIVPAFIPQIAERVDEPAIETADGVRLTFIREADLDTNNAPVGHFLYPGEGEGPLGRPRAASPAASTPVAVLAPAAPVAPVAPIASAVPVAPAAPAVPAVPAVPVAPAVPAGTPVPSLSYSSLAEYERCAYRFYVERVLGLPGGDTALPADGERHRGIARDAALERGTRVHALLQRIDFRHPVVPADATPELRELIAGLLDSELGGRLGDVLEARSEQRFAFLLGEHETLVTGTFDVLATERDGSLLVVDYKTGAVADYRLQLVIYAVAALRLGTAAGAAAAAGVARADAAVEVVHAFLEAGELRAAVFTPADLGPLQAELEASAEPLLRSRFPVADQPHRGLCTGCPALGGLCSWPAAVALRESSDRLF